LAFGAVIRVEFPMDRVSDEKWCFNPRDYDFPGYLVASKEAQESLQKASHEEYTSVIRAHPEFAPVINAAYKKFFDAGYPYPGASDADSSVVSFCSRRGKSLWGCVFSDRIFIYNLALTCCKHRVQAHLLARECRRYDYMNPRVIAVIDKDVKLNSFE
jgi:hypothetical protein